MRRHFLYLACFLQQTGDRLIQLFELKFKSPWSGLISLFGFFNFFFLNSLLFNVLWGEGNGNFYSSIFFFFGRNTLKNNIKCNTHFGSCLLFIEVMWINLFQRGLKNILKKKVKELLKSWKYQNQFEFHVLFNKSLQ